MSSLYNSLNDTEFSHKSSDVLDLIAKECSLETGDSQNTQVTLTQTYSHTAKPCRSNRYNQPIDGHTRVDPELNYLYSFRHKKHSTLLFLQPGPPQ